MQLRQAKPFGVLDHHHGRTRDVDADLDDGGGDQDLGLAPGEPLHGGVLVPPRQLAVHEADLCAEHLPQLLEALLGGGEVEGLRLADERADPIDEIACGDRAPDGADHLVETIDGDDLRGDRLAARRLLAQHGDVHIAETGERQGSRDRRRRHDEDIHRFALRAEGEALVHAEAVLLVHHGEAEIVKGDALLEERMRPDRDLHGPGGKPRQHRLAFGAAVAAGQKRDAQSRLPRQRLDAFVMLPRQDLRRSHDRRLPPGLDRACHGEQADHRLARPDISLEQAQHALVGHEILPDVLDGLLLRRREAEGERLLILSTSLPSPAFTRPGRRFIRLRTRASAS